MTTPTMIEGGCWLPPPIFLRVDTNRIMVAGEEEMDLCGR